MEKNEIPEENDSDNGGAGQTEGTANPIEIFSLFKNWK